LQSKTVTVNGVSLHYIESGSGPETIVFSHGYLMSHRMYGDQITALSASARVIAFDHRCHGDSEKVQTEFGLQDLVDDAAALIRDTRGGSVRLNSLELVCKWISRSLMPPPGLVTTG